MPRDGFTGRTPSRLHNSSTHRLPLNVPKFPEASSEALEVGSIDHWRRSLEQTDPIELLWPLRARGERQGDRDAADERDEFAPPHLSPSSTYPGSEYQMISPWAL